MARISLCEPQDLPPSLQRMSEEHGHDPMMVNMLQGFAPVPELIQSFMGWYYPWHANGEGVPARLPARLKELVRLRIATFTGCRLCKASRQQPDTISEDVAEYIDNPETQEKLSPAEAVAVQFAAKLATDHFSVTDADFAVLRRHFDNAQILELLVMVSVIYLGFGRVLSVLELDNATCPIPSAAPAWTTAPENAGMQAQRDYRALHAAPVEG
ncbi:carboxymuconolactone decarboxylase family protein [Sphingobium phenoxybenzoativorans]|uniref:Carboxymuconolactone decarboxylase family protein n=1 Tax=Sphingobium phenoxybenzoativorans TaxID=1592790 RepID=A0A975K3Q7_9SPHN|nr:carboxymuconolactone decarboxylase family protein [Sphingobium phenoxybenzoativorans]QUT04310.1 carboxymuconolactone decarboxylase family protein [Sphingobium phenoxybenzoativorans]